MILIIPLLQKLGTELPKFTNRVLLEKLMFPLLLKKLGSFYSIQHKTPQFVPVLSQTNESSTDINL